MEHLNFVKQIARSFEKRIYPHLRKTGKLSALKALSAGVDMLKSSQKFILPPVEEQPGNLLNALEAVRLPYPNIVIEQKVTKGALGNTIDSHGAQMFGYTYLAMELYDEDDGRMVICIHVFDGRQLASGEISWVQVPMCTFLRPDTTGRLDIEDGKCECRWQRLPVIENVLTHVPDDILEAVSTVSVQEVLGLISLLSCSNVKSVISPAKKVPKGEKLSAKKFDDYHILVLKAAKGSSNESVGEFALSSHRSPREHLRRGHIVRHHCGRNIWRRATIVNAGKGGKVTKDYAIAV